MQTLPQLFAKEWQKIIEAAQRQAQAELQAEGIEFFSAKDALDWQNLRNDLKAAAGDRQLMEAIGQEMDALMFDNDAKLEANYWFCRADDAWHSGEGL